MNWQAIKAFDWRGFFSALLDGGIAVFLGYAFLNFLVEIYFHQSWAKANWWLFSIEQQQMINQTLCLQDLNILITVGLIVLFIRLRK